MEEMKEILRDPETFCFNFDWYKHFDKNWKHEIGFIIKINECSAKNKMKDEIEQLLLKYKHRNNIHEHGKQQNKLTNRFFLNLSQRLDLKRSDKHVTLQNLSICYTWKNIRKHYKNNKLKKITSTSNDEFE